VRSAPPPLNLCLQGELRVLTVQLAATVWIQHGQQATLIDTPVYLMMMPFICSYRNKSEFGGSDQAQPYHPAKASLRHFLAAKYSVQRMVMRSPCAGAALDPPLWELNWRPAGYIPVRPAGYAQVSALQHVHISNSGSV
jgi:hypothetical protein